MPVLNNREIKMNKKSVFLLACMAGATLLLSCEHTDLYDGSKQPDENKKVTDLVIPPGFNWEMQTKASCIVSATKTSVISIFLDEACSEDKELMTLSTVAGESVPLPLNLPTHVKTIYIAYETVDGGKKVETVAFDGQREAHFTLPEDSREVTQEGSEKSRLVTRAGENQRRDASTNIVWVPSAYSWGTVLFEDMFPSLGDYDFNDYVLKYQISAQDVYLDRGIWKTPVVLVGIRVTAIGGSLPYTPYLRLLGMKNGDVSGMEILKMSPTVYEESDAIAWENEGEEEAPVILNFKKVVGLLDKPGGSPYFNTEKDYAVKNEDNYMALIELDEPIAVEELYAGKLDFYLKKADGMEIHLQGFEPVDYAYSFEGGIPYRSKDGFVWGLNVPSDIPHVVEQASFLSAYRAFEKWVVSGGDKSQNWYELEMDKDFLIPLR